MKLYIVGGKSPTGKALIEILRKHKIRFLAPADKYFDPDNALAITKSIRGVCRSHWIALFVISRTSIQFASARK